MEEGEGVGGGGAEGSSAVGDGGRASFNSPHTPGVDGTHTFASLKACQACM